MSRTKRRAGTLQSAYTLSAAALVMGVLLAPGLAHGQDAVPAAKPAANPVTLSDDTNRADSANKANSTNKGSQTAAPSGDPAGGSSASGAQGAPSGAQSGSGAQAAGKPQPVCFQLTGRCVEGAKASRANTHSASKDGSAAQRPLNLTAPDVRTVVSADELKEPLPSNEQVAEVQEADTVSVKSEGVPTDVPGGLGAIWWALNHPSQAWRIVVPAE